MKSPNIRHDGQGDKLEIYSDIQKTDMMNWKNKKSFILSTTCLL